MRRNHNLDSYAIKKFAIRNRNISQKEVKNQ